jgi:RNA-binding protein
MSTTNLARIVSRLASFGPQQEFAVDLADDALRTALESLASSAGATMLPADDTSTAPAGIIDIPLPPLPLMPARVKALIGRVAQGGQVVVVIQHCEDNPQHAAQQLGPLFDLHKVHGEREGDTIILRGTRRLPIERARMKVLRQIAHDLPATVLIGREGLSASLIAAAQVALERHGLVKVRQTSMCKTPKEEVVSDLVWATGGQVVSRIGRVTVLYRSDLAFEPPKSHR